ncbi:hypothetical protein B9J78_01605 [bacterium Unc6]|nr:hypothetical protein [bacterium Unc6]
MYSAINSGIFFILTYLVLPISTIQTLWLKKTIKFPFPNLFLRTALVNYSGYLLTFLVLSAIPQGIMEYKYYEAWSVAGLVVCVPLLVFLSTPAILLLFPSAKPVRQKWLYALQISIKTQPVFCIICGILFLIFLYVLSPKYHQSSITLDLNKIIIHSTDKQKKGLDFRFLSLKDRGLNIADEPHLIVLTQNPDLIQKQSIIENFKKVFSKEIEKKWSITDLYLSDDGIMLAVIRSQYYDSIAYIDIINSYVLSVHHSKNNERIFYPRLSDDKESIAFIQADETSKKGIIYVIRRGTGGKKLKVYGKPVSLQGLYFGPEKEQITFVDLQNRIRTVRFFAKKSEILFEGRYPLWSKDYQHILFCGTDNKPYIHNMGKNKKTRINLPGYTGGVFIALTDGYIMYRGYSSYIAKKYNNVSLFHPRQKKMFFLASDTTLPLSFWGGKISPKEK